MIYGNCMIAFRWLYPQSPVGLPSFNLLKSMIHLIWSLIVGFIIGYIARAIMPGAQHLGFLMTSLLGIGGSFVGGFIGQLISKPREGANFHPAGILMSIVGALILLWAYTKFGH